jgi:Mn2+/Fe2+ NRAMP family transporter
LVGWLVVNWLVGWLLLCSALVAGQARGKPSHSLKQLCLYNFLDIAAALGLALVVNVAVLLVAAATFHQAGEVPRGGGGWAASTPTTHTPQDADCLRSTFPHPKP